MKRKLHVKGIYGKEYLLQKLFLHKKSSEMTWVKGKSLYCFFYCVEVRVPGVFIFRLRTRSHSILCALRTEYICTPRAKEIILRMHVGADESKRLVICNNGH